MANISEEKLREIVNSDMKLWEYASVNPHPQGIAKTLILPWGLGERTIVFPPAKSAQEKVGQVEQFGATIRGWIDEIKRAGEEDRAERFAREARATENGPSPGGGAGSSEPAAGGAPQVADQAPVPSPVEVAETGPDFASRANALERAIRDEASYIRDAHDRIKRWNKELTALRAAMEIMDAPEDDAEERGDVQTEVQGA